MYEEPEHIESILSQLKREKDYQAGVLSGKEEQRIIEEIIADGLEGKLRPDLKKKYCL